MNTYLIKNEKVADVLIEHIIVGIDQISKEILNEDIVFILREVVIKDKSKAERLTDILYTLANKVIETVETLNYQNKIN